ncbi:hypothetical protein CLOP_g23831 [Closterium sp. NIES-67]|nr:hypothetical protein CLOP_g23831 [Closterium sp. NIES-67]
MAKSLTSRVVLAVGWHGWHKSPLVAASAVTAALLLLLLPLSVDVALMWSSDANSSSHLATMLGEHCGGPPMLSAHDSDALDLSQCSAKGEAFSASADRLGLSSLQAGPQTANGGRLCLQQQQQAQRRQIIESSSSSGGGSSMAAQQLDDLLLLTRHDTLVLALSSVPKPSLANLRRLFTHVRVVDPISVREGRGMRELLEEFAVLHLWNQTDFQRIVYVDPLSLFKDNCNHMFGVFRPFAAPPLRFPPDLFSTRVMLIQPQSATLHHMVSAIESAPLRPLQTAYLDLFLNAYYGTWYRESTLHRMPYEYGLNLWMRQRLHQYYPHPRIVNFDGQSPLDTEDLDNWRDFDKRKGNMGQEWLDLRRAALALLEK